MDKARLCKSPFTEVCVFTNTKHQRETLACVVPLPRLQPTVADSVAAAVVAVVAWLYMPMSSLLLLQGVRCPLAALTYTMGTLLKHVRYAVLSCCRADDYRDGGCNQGHDGGANDTHDRHSQHP